MRYLFFFSYARDNRDEYLLRFYKDLRRCVEGLAGLSDEEKLHTDIAFLDERNLEAGADWEPALLDALQNSAVLLCAYSPSYFVSEYCSREWHVFQMRRRLSGQSELPPAIKPVIWISPARRMTREAVHPDVWGVQFTLGKTDAIYNTDGIEPMLRMINRYRTPYQALISELAVAILKAADICPALPVLPPPLPRLNEIPPLFPLKKFVTPAAAQPAHPSPLVLATVQLGQAAPAAHSEHMAPWRPFGTSGDSVDAIAQNIAMQDLNTACHIEHVATIADLLALRQAAAARYQALVIFTDPASAALLAQGPADLHGYPLLVLGADAPPAPGQTAVASAGALRALLVDQVPRLLSQTRAHLDVNLPSSIGKPIISASTRQE